jgi:hypothetical protein
MLPTATEISLGCSKDIWNRVALYLLLSHLLCFLLNALNTESGSELHYVLTTRPLRPTTSNFLSQLNTYGHSPYVTSSLTRGWVCRLQLLLVLASTVIHRSDSRGTHDQILLSQIRDSPNLEGQVPVFISPRNRVARLYPQALGSLFVAFYESQG